MTSPKARSWPSLLILPFAALLLAYSRDSLAASATTPKSPTRQTAKKEIVESHPGISEEANYAEAVMAFNDKKYPQAITLLDGILKFNPKNIEALELKALSLKIQSKDLDATRIYESLLKLKPEAQRVPYHFELGSILFKNKKSAEAKEHLEKALEKGFNSAACHFFLGLISFEFKRWDEAEGHFSALEAEGSAEFQVAAQYYLGLVYFQNGYGSGATHSLLKASQGAEKIKNSAIATQIGAAAKKALAPFDKSQWYANITLLGQYDGNAALIPDEAVSDSQASGRAIPKVMLIAGVGRLSSPLRVAQWTPGLRFTGNKNIKAATQDLEFASTQPSLYLTIHPLAKTHWGLRADGNLTFQNSFTAGYQIFNLGGEIGAFLKSQFSRVIQFALEATFRPNKFYTDKDESPDTNRTGYNVFGRTSLRFDFPGRFFRPDFSMSVEWMRPSGRDFQGINAGFDLGNSMRLTGNDTLTQSVSLTYAVYGNHSTAPSNLRSDFSYTLKLGYLRVLTTRLSLLADLGYTANISNMSSQYSYTKPSGSLGLSLTL